MRFYRCCFSIHFFPVLYFFLLFCCRHLRPECWGALCSMYRWWDGKYINLLLLNHLFKSARPLRPGLHTCYNGGYRRQLAGDRMLIPKSSLSSDRSLQPVFVKLDSLVIAHQPRRGEYVPGPCTHRPSSHGSRGYLKYVTARIVLG